MRFTLIDQLIEYTPERLIAVKNVTSAEEYLQDHFPTFPVLPGVFMIEALVQSAREWLIRSAPMEGVPSHAAAARMVLGRVRAVKYGSFVRPGEAMRLEITPTGIAEDGGYDFKGTGTVLRVNADPTLCVAGRFSMRPISIAGGNVWAGPEADNPHIFGSTTGR